MRRNVTSYRGGPAYEDLLIVSDLARHATKLDEIYGETDDIRHVAQRMQLLAQDLTTYGQVDSHALKLYPQELPLLDSMRAATRSIYYDSRRHPIRLPAETPSVFADPQRVVQVLANLIGNAVKYSPRGGPVTLSAAAADSMVTVSVSDHGLGIPEADLERLFTAFFRTARDERSDIPGTGLGLTIVKSLVEGHGGRVWLDSVEGEGTTFHFTLPATREMFEERCGSAGTGI